MNDRQKALQEKFKAFAAAMREEALLTARKMRLAGEYDTLVAEEHAQRRVPPGFVADVWGDFATVPAGQATKPPADLGE